MIVGAVTAEIIQGLLTGRQMGRAFPYLGAAMRAAKLSRTHCRRRVDIERAE